MFAWKIQCVLAPHENEAMLIPPFEIVRPQYVASWTSSVQSGYARYILQFMVNCHGEYDDIPLKSLEFSGYLVFGSTVMKPCERMTL